jgi:site-specific DNA recombinase
MPRHRKAGRGLDGGVAASSAASGGLRPRRCAIYTRKSTEEGLGQEFNSLDAQREACASFIASQRHEGWRVLPPHAYDDGGYSGGSMERPGLQALLAAIDAGAVDVVVVYKVDRLTRSLSDFAKIVERFDAKGVSFVSVTQAFNTTTSMGRLTLNVLLSFAQFEREVGAERVRDKIAASRRKGLWMGGGVPMGYRAENRRLVVDEAEAERVKTIFDLYLKLGSTTALLAELRRRSIVTARRISRAGRVTGGGPFGTGAISYLLHNRTYVGEVEHKGHIHPGEQATIVDREIFDAVQRRLAENANVKRRRAASRAILTGRIFDSRGNRMSPTHATKNGVRYRYYVTRALAEGRPIDAGEVARAPAPEVERIVLEAIRKQAAQGGSSGGREPDGDDQAQLTLVERHLRRVEVHRDRLIVTLTPADKPADAAGDPASDVTLIVSWSPPASLPRREIVLAADVRGPQASPMQVQLVAAIVTARGWLHALVSGKFESVEAIASREGKHPRSIRAALSFAFVAPDIVEAIMAGDVPKHLTLTDIGRGLPMLWSDQRRMMAA